MSNQLAGFIRDAEEIISEVENEILNRKKGKPGDGSVQQLEFIREELNQIKSFALTNSLPPRANRYTSFSRYVVDEWDTNSILGQRLCEVASIYKRKL